MQDTPAYRTMEQEVNVLRAMLPGRFWRVFRWESCMESKLRHLVQTLVGPSGCFDGGAIPEYDGMLCRCSNESRGADWS